MNITRVCKMEAGIAGVVKDRLTGGLWTRHMAVQVQIQQV